MWWVFFSPNLPQGFLTWNIITSLPYGLIYILLQVKLIRLRNMLKIPQSILNTVKTLVISCLPVWLWMTLYLFRDPQCQVTLKKQNKASFVLPAIQKSLNSVPWHSLLLMAEQHQKASKTYLPEEVPLWVLDFPGGEEHAIQPCSSVVIRLYQVCVWCNYFVLTKRYQHFSHNKSTNLSATHRRRTVVESKLRLPIKGL